MMQQKIATTILTTARDGGDRGATISNISKAVHDLHIANWPSDNWPSDGSIPSHTGGYFFKRALAALNDLRFVVVENLDSQLPTEEIRKLGHVDRDRANRIYVRIAKSFELIQEILGFSLSEHATRTENSLIASPSFSLKRPTNFDVFVLMPFAEALKTSYTSVIQPVCEVRSLKCARGDDFYGSEYIVDEIWTAIYYTDYIIADLTSRNPNVFYELGIAHMLGKEVLIISQKEADVPFDLRHRRFTLYNTRPEGLDLLKTAINGYLDTRLPKLSSNRS